MVSSKLESIAVSTQHRNRASLYAIIIPLLLGIGYCLQDTDWQGSVTLHTLMETSATLLAFFVGILALIRYLSQQDAKFLYIGAGFLGTALLDAYHTIVTSAYFAPRMPSEYVQLVPWSWSASRLFLSILMCVSWLLWIKHKSNSNFTVSTRRTFWITGLATLSCFLVFTVLPLPPISTEHSFLHRPFEFASALFFLIALIGYLRKGLWRDDDFEHWLVLSLIVGFATQTIFMPFSAHLHDTDFNVAHLLKKLSYILVLTGLLISLYKTYITLRIETQKRMALEQALRDEAEALSKREHWFRSIADYTYHWEVWVSVKGRLLYTSPSCERISGYPKSAFMSGEISLLDIISPKEDASVFEHIKHVSDNEGPLEFDFRIITKDGCERWVSSASQPIFDANGFFAGRRSSFMDITERKKLESEVRQLAFYDMLTQLPNRRLLDDRLNQAMAASKRSGCYGALMFIDLDNFKPLNDLHGHAVGDLLLIEVSHRLKSCVREIDSVARFGGDEFVVMLSELSTDKAGSTVQAEVVAEKIRASLSKTYLLAVSHDGDADKLVEHHCSASIGVALFLNHVASQDDVLKWADDAMYDAKDAGRNQIRFYAESL
jgi:diguanylate cyclase (GGDEF)-like protein/PAS domain S-box-containing protein